MVAVVMAALIGVTTAAPAEPPAGVCPEDWASILTQLQNDTYAFQADAAGLAARNPAQDFRLRCATGGLSVEADGVVVRVRAVSLNGTALPDREPQVSGQRVEFHRGPVVEWFENRPEGLEQGFTIAHQSESQVELAVSFQTEFRVTVAEDGQAVLVTDDDGAVQYRYAQLHVVDVAGRRLEALFERPAGVPPHTIVIACDVSGAQFPITVDPILTRMEKSLSAPMGPGDAFGAAAAVDGDVVVIGMPCDDRGADNQGNAFVFERNEGGTNAWGRVAELFVSDGTTGDLFGCSVALAGDVIVVGARYADVGTTTHAGAAYVFERNADRKTNQWRRVAKLTATAGIANAEFGGSVSVAGDVIAVGSPNHDTIFDTDRGLVHIFERNQDGTNLWGLVDQIWTPTAVSDAHFGYAVSVDGSVMAVGAPGINADRGAAFIFQRVAGRTGTWEYVRQVTASDGEADDNFGCGVDVEGDVLVVGASLDDVGGNANQGSAYVFERNAGRTNRWGEVARLAATNGAPGDWAGASVAVAGDMVLVGAYRDDVGTHTNQGAVYAFERNAGGTNAWGQVAEFTASGATNDDWFGDAVAADGDVIAVGAWNTDSSRGAAYVFPKRLGDWTETAHLAALDGAAEDAFGQSVAAAGDVVVVGAWGDDVGSWEDQGSAYVYERNKDGTNAWGQVRQLTDPDGYAFDQFGASVAAAGDVIAVGAVGYNIYKGAVHIFERNAGSTNGWGRVAELVVSGGEFYDEFGCSVAADGDVVVAGAIGVSNFQGAAYVYERQPGLTSDWRQVARLMASDGSSTDWFGTAVAAAGDVVVVGAAYDDIGVGGEDRGSAYVFERNAGGTNAWGQVAKLTGSALSYDYFGISVAAAGDVIAVGENYGGPEVDQGLVYVFERNAGGTNAWGRTKVLEAADAAGGDSFGSSVAVSGDSIAVGTPGKDEGTNGYQGAVYIFSRNVGGKNAWGQVRKMAARDGAMLDGFGNSVAAAGDIIVAGTRGDDVGVNTNQGSACVFEGIHYPVPALTGVRMGGTNCVVGWRSAVEMEYGVQSAASLPSGAWTDVPGCTSICAVGEATEATNDVSGATSRFYRVQLLH